MKLFTGTANPTLVQQVSDILHIPITHSEVVRFDNSEVRVRIEEDVKNETCVVIQPTANPTDTNLMELFFFCDALRRQEAKKVIGFVPYFGYARQDIQHRDGECISANVVIRFMESIGFSKIYTFDLHDEATSGVFTIPFKNATTFPALATDVKNYLGDRFNKDHIAIASPDQGGIERARNFGIELFGDDDFDLTVVEKHRDQENKHQSEALGIYGQVKDKVVVLVDDIVTSGGTLVHAAQLAMEHGAQSVLAVIVHHDFSEHAKSRIMESRIERFFTTNTIALKEEYRFDKLHEVSVAGLIAEELKGII